jgi:DNA-binding transcriptional regulator YiaG
MIQVHRIIAARMRAEGHSDAAIAAAVGCTRQNVHRVLGPRETPSPLVYARPETARNDFARALRSWRQAHLLTRPKAARILRVAIDALRNWEDAVHGCPAEAKIRQAMEKYTVRQSK